MSGERLLLDSTFIAGLINSRDQLHFKAKAFLPMVEAAAEGVITEAVLIEVGNLLHSVQQRQRAAEFIDACYGTTNVTIVSVDTELLRKAVDFYRLHLRRVHVTHSLRLWATGTSSASPTGALPHGRATAPLSSLWLLPRSP